MHVLVTGGLGFIGREVVAGLLRAGHRVRIAGRPGRAQAVPPGVDFVGCDFGRDLAAADWCPRLEGIDAVVNCAGILRERGSDTFEAIHVLAPLALYEACAIAGVRRIVQVSALGDPADGEFVASKHRGDARLMAMDLDWVVLRPSVVASARGSYGGTSLLRALAALPLTPLPGTGAQRLQPVALEDLVTAVLAALTRAEAARQVIEIGGPAALTLREYLALWRRWLGLGTPRFLPVPQALARIGATLGELLGRGPMGLTMWRMLERGNVTATDAPQRAQALLGCAPRALVEHLAESPSHSADRWHARLHLLAPVLRGLLALTFLASGVVGLLLPPAEVQALMAPTGWSHGLIDALTWGGSVADLVLGALLLTGWRTPWVLAGMAAMVLGYTLVIGAFLPAAWLDPFGGLLKNPLILLAIAIAAVTAERD
jgi:uncharacterized protein YbjT (DUF2867 family)/uncharacterized membrane protein YphA (DoxX/SURF4 family)